MKRKNRRAEWKGRSEMEEEMKKGSKEKRKLTHKYRVEYHWRMKNKNLTEG